MFIQAEQDKANIFATVERGTIKGGVAATGSLQPVRHVDVCAQVSGQLQELCVQVRPEVHKGDLLVEIDAEATAAGVERPDPQRQPVCP